jgi:hypothetical protein
VSPPIDRRYRRVDTLAGALVLAAAGATICAVVEIGVWWADAAVTVFGVVVALTGIKVTARQLAKPCRPVEEVPHVVPPIPRSLRDERGRL